MTDPLAEMAAADTRRAIQFGQMLDAITRLEPVRRPTNDPITPTPRAFEAAAVRLELAGSVMREVGTDEAEFGRAEAELFAARRLIDALLEQFLPGQSAERVRRLMEI